MKKKILSTLLIALSLAFFTPVHAQTCADMCSIQYNIDYNMATEDYRSQLYDVLEEAQQVNNDIWENAETMLTDPFGTMEEIWEDLEYLFEEYLPNMWETTAQMEEDWYNQIDSYADQMFACMEACPPNP